MVQKKQHRAAIRQRGFSMLELLAVVVIIGVIAGIVLARISGDTLDARKNACYVNKGNIEVQVRLWNRNKGSWPAANLSDIGADASYFPEGVSTCPVDGSSYTIDSSTGLVTGHSH